MTASVGANPYVGPRAIAYGEPIYGRDFEIDDLTGTVVSRRIVLLYSPSGAGKSSLVEAGVRPQLEERGFQVLPTVRVGHAIDVETSNRYLMSTKLSLSELVPPDQRWDQERLATVTLEQHLERVISVAAEPDRDPCLIFDQFEELFTVDPVDWDEKRAFVAELGVALRRRDRWALFAMREDYIAQLDPLLSLLPTRLSARYRLDLLEPDAARLAVIRPAENADVEFVRDAADQLIDDLRKTRVNRSGETITVPGRYVEPVVLQAVCRRLWEQSGSRQRIDVADVKALGDVDDALADFCDDRFAQAAIEAGVPEQRIRDWIERELITEQGFRSQTASGPTDDGPAVLRALEDRHLLRAESRRGTTWYEIPHDRLVPPIRSSNRRWLGANLDPVQTAARAWNDNARSVDMLLRGTLLDNAERWVVEHPAEVLPLDQEFVDASRAGQQRRDRRHRRLLAAVSVLAVLTSALVGVVAWALVRSSSAEEAEAQARAEAAEAFAAGLQEAVEETKKAADDSEARAELEEQQAEAAEAQLDALRQDQAASSARLEAAEAAAEVAQRRAAEAAEEAEEARAVSVAAQEAAAKAEAEDAAQRASEAWDGEYVDEPNYPGSVEVRLGEAGSTVGWLQQELRARDFDVAPDCRFGRATEDQVKAVQELLGLAVTGVADDEFWTALGIDVDSTTRLFSCEPLEPIGGDDACTIAVPNPDVRLVVKNIPPDDPDGGLNFRPEPSLQGDPRYPAENGTVFTATGTCSRTADATWLELRDEQDDLGWASAGSLFLVREPLVPTGIETDRGAATG